MSDDADVQRFIVASKNLARLKHRSKEGVEARKKGQAEYRKKSKKNVARDCELRDGPQFNTKLCGLCSQHVDKSSNICPNCQQPSTKRGAEALTTTKAQPRAFGPSNSTSANQEALASTMDTISNREDWLVAEVKGKRGNGEHVEYLIR